MSRSQNAEILDMLAAAYAAAGEFSGAVAAAEKAEQLAQDFNKEALKEKIQKHLRLYKQGQPYIEPAQKGPFD